jgi:hypothetical protein
MQCDSLKYSEHAVVQMFKRNISIFEVQITIDKGEVIKSYFNDKPYPSFLILGLFKDKVIHVVLAVNTQIQECVVITAYIPDLEIWNSDFKTKKK